MQIEVNGVKLGYGVDGKGPPLVLLHGFPLNRTMWESQVAALRDRFTVITPDLRGFGESDPPANPDEMTMDTYAGDVLRLLDALKHDRVALGGLSMGGYVLFRVLAQARERISALVIADSRAGPDSEEARERRRAGIERIRTEGPEGFVKEFVVALVGPAPGARPEVLETVRRISGVPSPPALIGALTAMAARPDSRTLLPSVAVPTLVLVGEGDRVTPPEAAQEIAVAIKDARLVTLPGAGHMSNLEEPDLFNRALRDFLPAQAST